jgi:CheY-like chemotaxis protein
MLGLASYQEALRAIGRLCAAATRVRIAEQADRVCIEIGPDAPRSLSKDNLEEILLASHAHRGEHRPAGPLADILRSVGAALDQLKASNICLELSEHTLSVRYSGNRELTYAGEELEALRRTAAARRNGQPLSRVLILEVSPDSAAHLREPLLAEFAVQALPALLARAVVAMPEAPGLVLVQCSELVEDAIKTLRSAAQTAAVPIVVVASPGGHPDPGQLFSAGADDLLQEPLQPAQLRARVRTWLLRGRASPQV